jgi:hypothetical protein
MNEQKPSDGATENERGAPDVFERLRGLETAFASLEKSLTQRRRLMIAQSFVVAMLASGKEASDEIIEMAYVMADELLAQEGHDDGQAKAQR